jgi:hypothetical protein
MGESGSKVETADYWEYGVYRVGVGRYRYEWQHADRRIYANRRTAFLEKMVLVPTEFFANLLSGFRFYAWYRFLHPHPFDSPLLAYSPPVAITVGHHHLILLNVNDGELSNNRVPRKSLSSAVIINLNPVPFGYTTLVAVPMKYPDYIVVFDCIVKSCPFSF